MGEKSRGTLSAVERALAEARGLVAGHPTVEAARERLGDRVSTESGVGGAVRVASGLGVEHLGVVIFRKDGAADVWLGAGRVRRLANADEARAASAEELSSSLHAVADAAIVFASLVEGQRVRFQVPDGASREGLLVEKCRYGALVLDEDDKVMAIGFQGLAPVPDETA